MESRKPKDSSLPSSLFLVPLNYFDEFNDRTMMKITHSEKSSLIFGNFQTFFLRAAAVLILALTVPLINQFNKSSIASEEIERYLALSNIDDMELATILNAADLENINTNIKIDDSVVEDILLSNNNFETYITN